MLSGRKILLGVTGSIAAVKAPIVARELMRRSATVVPVLTTGALEFTTAAALSALTRQPAITEIFPSQYRHSTESGTWHIHLGRSADAMLVAPCSAKTIGLLAHGIYENAVTLLASSLARTTPLVVAPAMDEEMWLQPAVQRNVDILQEYGVHVIQPTTGALASGLSGTGRMLEPRELIDAFEAVVSPHGLLAGKRVLITGGPTYEPIDAVRFIGNRSSGKMAAAIAEQAARRGARVELVMGPSAVETSDGIHRTNIETAQQMLHAVLEKLPAADVVVMNAAVADFRPVEATDTKLKKREMQSLGIVLTPTDDILHEISARRRPDQFVVGFALEKGERAEDYALAKLEEKQLDMIVLNDIATEGVGFTHDTNQVSMYFKGGEVRRTAVLPKQEIAKRILEQIEHALEKRV